MTAKKLRTEKRLTAVEVGGLAKAKADRTRLHHDGGGLYLVVDKRGGAAWAYRYTINGAARTMGLGPYPSVSLADARTLADEARQMKRKGKDPLAERAYERAAARQPAGQPKTFKECAEAYIVSHSAGWRNAKHAKQWTATLKAYAYPIIGSKPAASIDVELVMAVLEQAVGDPPQRLWVAKPETASRVRGRIEAVLGWAQARGYRPAGDNPAAWKGRLEYQLPATDKIKPVEHHAALPYAHVKDFVAALRLQPGFAARALEFAILTAARTSEVLNATWAEVDLGAKVWTVPGKRMKAGREHRVPLSDRAVAILESMRTADSGADDFLFPGGKPGRPLSDMAFLMLLRRMKRDDLTAHGFRSTFRDWAGEVSAYPREVAEAALAHRLGDDAEQAYRRGDALEKRRRMMRSWANFCEGVVSIDEARAAKAA
ncbi:MAG: integrase arm-type DNA-binding domain-containing protein [Caulobacteraceae bacterium]|nr:integrase arm-type DNA-binding domain-containing protein [Caulobacteraceae bacterium]